MSSDRPTGFSSAFDELLERSRRELDALSGGSGAPALSPTPRTSPSPSAGSTETSARRSASQGVSTPARGSSPASRSPAERALDEKLGPGWRCEVLDRTREGGELLVRCRVTAPARGVSRTWHGSAPLSGASDASASGMTGTTGNVRFSLRAGAAAGTRTHDPIRAEREAEQQAIESALAACARLL